MNGTFRQSMRWLHTWVGLVLSTVLYFMFITGSAGYFDEEITHWMQPEVPVVDASIDQSHMLTLAEKRLNAIAPKAQEWWVVFPVGREDALTVWWKGHPKSSTNKQGRAKWTHEILHPQTGELIVARKTGGGNALYQMHYALYYMPKVLGYWITSLAAMFMLIALITGIVIHKKIFVDFFTFRPGKKQRSWLDMHNVLSVLPLPFHLMITYSGLVLLMLTSMPGAMIAAYGTDDEARQQFIDTVYEKEAPVVGGNTLVQGVTIGSLLSDVETHWGHDQISFIGVKNQGTVGARVEISRQGYSGLSDGDNLIYHGVNGELLEDTVHQTEQPLASKTFYDVLNQLHEGQFAGVFLRWLYFLSGLMGAGMIATGSILWAVKRREKAEREGQSSKGLVLVECLNLTTIVGLPIAVAAYFWANRLIPAEMLGRGAWEVHTLFIVWGLVSVPAMFVRTVRARQLTWANLLWLAAMVYGLIPVLNGFTSQRHLGYSLIQGDWMMAGFDLTMLLLAVLFAVAAKRIERKHRHAQSKVPSLVGAP